MKVQSVACGIPSVKALPKEVAGDGRLCCCGREKEHPAELAASIPAGKCGDKGTTKALWQEQGLCNS